MTLYDWIKPLTHIMPDLLKKNLMKIYEEASKFSAFKILSFKISNKKVL